MLVLDNNLLTDYLNGSEPAKAFLQQHEYEEWAVSSVVLYEAMMGAVYGHFQTSPLDVKEGVTAAMAVLPTTGTTAATAVRLQERLLDLGAPVAQLDALIAASAHEHGGTFATAEKGFWREDVRSVIAVEPYDPF